MVTRLLNLCGLHLGADDDLMPPHSYDNAAGYWENMRFVGLNEALLATLGGRWDQPPQPPPAWWEQPPFGPFREQATHLIADFEGSTPWGWKDPRTCLTLPFWQHLLPNLTLVCCLRNPLEVMLSLGLRTNEPMLSDNTLSLWTTYYQRLLQTVDPAHLIITHYASYFYDPHAELQRLLDALGLTPTQQAFEAAIDSIQPDLRHVVNDGLDLSDKHLPPTTVRLYDTLREHSGPVYEEMIADEAYWMDQLKTGQRTHYFQLAAESDRAIRTLSAHEQLQAENDHLHQTLAHLASEGASLKEAHEQLVALIQRVEEDAGTEAETSVLRDSKVATLLDTLGRLEKQQAHLKQTIGHLETNHVDRETKQAQLITSVSRLEGERALLESQYEALLQECDALETERTSLANSVAQLTSDHALIFEERTRLQTQLSKLESKHAAVATTLDRITHERTLLAAEKKSLLHALGTIAHEKSLLEIQCHRYQDEWHSLEDSFLARTLLQLQDRHPPDVTLEQLGPANGHLVSPLHFFLDTPSPDSAPSCTSPLEVHGWAFSTQGPIERIEVFLGTEPLGTVTYGLDRPDVAKAFPHEHHARHSGFSQAFDIYDMPPGIYELVILASDGMGNARAFCMPLTLEASPPTS